MLTSSICRLSWRSRTALLSAIQHSSGGSSTRPIISSAVHQLPKTKDGHVSTDSAPNGGNFNVIYKFPFIRVAHVVCRLKIYQTSLTALTLPYVGYLTHCGLADLGTLGAVVGVCSLALVMLGVMGEIFRRLVGHMYYDSTRDLVKISHLTFWGGRKDIYLPVADIVPLVDTSDNLKDIYVRILRYSQPKFSLFLCLKFGGIVDHDLFHYVFGDVKAGEN